MNEPEPDPTHPSSFIDDGKSEESRSNNDCDEMMIADECLPNSTLGTLIA